MKDDKNINKSTKTVTTEREDKQSCSGQITMLCVKWFFFQTFTQRTMVSMGMTARCSVAPLCPQSQRRAAALMINEDFSVRHIDADARKSCVATSTCRARWRKRTSQSVVAPAWSWNDWQTFRSAYHHGSTYWKSSRWPAGQFECNVGQQVREVQDGAPNLQRRPHQTRDGFS